MITCWEMASWLIWGENGRESGTGAQRRGDARRRWHCPRRSAGAVRLRTLDQEAAVGPEQGHTRSVHRRGERHKRYPIGCRRNKGCEKSNLGNPGDLRFTGGRAGNQGARLRGEHRGRRGPAAGHPAVAGNLAMAARAFAALRNVNRLHPHECGADNGEQDPGDASHARWRRLFDGLRGAIVNRHSGQAPTLGPGWL